LFLKFYRTKVQKVSQKITPRREYLLFLCCFPPQPYSIYRGEVGLPVIAKAQPEAIHRLPAGCAFGYIRMTTPGFIPALCMG
jgi:hypothetical protein